MIFERITAFSMTFVQNSRLFLKFLKILFFLPKLSNSRLFQISSFFGHPGKIIMITIKVSLFYKQTLSSKFYTCFGWIPRVLLCFVILWLCSANLLKKIFLQSGQKHFFSLIFWASSQSTKFKYVIKIDK